METLNKICNQLDCGIEDISNTFLIEKQTEAEPQNAAIF